MLIGAHPYPPIYKEGDLLDANAIINLITNKSDYQLSYKNLEEKVNKYKEQVDKSLD